MLREQHIKTKGGKNHIKKIMVYHNTLKKGEVTNEQRIRIFEGMF